MNPQIVQQRVDIKYDSITSIGIESNPGLPLYEQQGRQRVIR